MQLQRWCSCLSGKEDWVFGALRDWHQRPIGHLGQTACLRFTHEHHMCVLSSWKNWRDLLREHSACEKPRTATLLASEGMEVPVWSRFPVADFRAPQPVDPEVGEWTHGWQFHASVVRNSLFATSVHLPPLSTDHRALRASQRGPCASRHFSCLPTSPETTFSAEEFRTLLLVRLHLPLHLDARFCKCGELLDVYGHHRSACSRVGP